MPFPAPTPPYTLRMPDAPRRHHDAIDRGREQARREQPVSLTLGYEFFRLGVAAVGAGILAVHLYRKDGHWVAAALVAVGLLGVLVRMVWLAVADARVRRDRMEGGRPGSARARRSRLREQVRDER